MTNKDLIAMKLTEDDINKALATVKDSLVVDIATGLICKETLSWHENYINFRTCLDYDHDTKEIIIDEQKLLNMIMLVNPMQPPRNLKFKNGGKVL